VNSVLQKIFSSVIRTGTLTVTTASGRKFMLGDGSGKPIAVRFTSLAAELGMLFNPELKVGESYMNGTFVIDEGSMADVLALALAQEGAGKVPHWTRPQSLIRQLNQGLRQLVGGGHRQAGVLDRLDLEQFYSYFLDDDMQLSCAYFEAPDQSLEEAQLAKNRHIAAKLLIKPGNLVLDIGSGWGALAFFLAEVYDARVHGVTLSPEHVASARARATSRGLDASVMFDLQDYRNVVGTFDRLVAIELAENVGVGQFEAFFRKCGNLVKEDGVILLQLSGRPERMEISNPFISKYLFPGVYLPALSQLLPAIEGAGLVLADVEILRGHYAATIKIWRERFRARRDEIERHYGESFYRMWDFWFACSEVSVEHAVVYQLQLAKRHDVVPLTHDYIAREEARLRGLKRERSSAPPALNTSNKGTVGFRLSKTLEP
jgi:cyclopropane-fatty-acyl-phospholipid synthase